MTETDEAVDDRTHLGKGMQPLCWPFRRDDERVTFTITDDLNKVTCKECLQLDAVKDPTT